MINKGITLGLFPDISILILCAVWVGVVIYAVKVRELWGRIGLGLIALGGGMNLYSRFVYGGVRDPWSLLGLLYNNGADYMIFFGIVIYGYTYFVRR